MREILFRGQRTDNDEWIKGYLHKIDGVGKGYRAYAIQVQDIDTYMCRPHSHEVQPNTVGQFTGLTDKNGTKIFEGDICRNTQTGEIVSVKWHGTMAGFVWSKRKEKSYLFDFGELFRVYDKYEVIGNIHDNPELLEVE